MVELWVWKDKKPLVTKIFFNSITEAYHYYLWHFSALGDWWYYFWCAHLPLSSIKDEHAMYMISKNVFKNGRIHLDRNHPKYYEYN